MKVKDLIEMLKDKDPNAVVLIEHSLPFAEWRTDLSDIKKGAIIRDPELLIREEAIYLA